MSTTIPKSKRNSMIAKEGINIKIDIAWLASKLARDYELSASDIRLLQSGVVPDGWTEAIISNIEDRYNLSNIIADIISMGVE